MHKLNRRSAIVATGCVLATRSLGAALAQDSSTLPIIDTHQHLWDLSKFKLPWLEGPKDNILARDYLPSDYVRATAECNVKQAVYMEVDVAVELQNAEADYVLDLCRQPKSLTKGAVISGRPGEESFPKYIERFADQPLIKGVRQVLHGPTPAGYCNSAQFVRSVQLLGELGKSFDLCMRSAELLDAVRLVDACPKTRFVLDHCGNGPVRSNDKDAIAKWQKGVKELSQRPQVICKISGIVASAPEDWKPADLAPVVNFCLDAFGEDRVIFAGDWPVCLIRASFKQWVDALKSIVSDRSEAFKRKLFHDNAIKFYGLEIQ